MHLVFKIIQENGPFERHSVTLHRHISSKIEAIHACKDMTDTTKRYMVYQIESELSEGEYNDLSSQLLAIASIEALSTSHPEFTEALSLLENAKGGDSGAKYLIYFDKETY